MEKDTGDGFMWGVAATVLIMGLMSGLLLLFPIDASKALPLGEYWRTMDVVPFCLAHGFKDGYITLDIGERPRTPYIACYSTIGSDHNTKRFEIREAATIMNATW